MASETATSTSSSSASVIDSPETRRERLEAFLSQRWVMVAMTVLPVLLLFSFINLFPIAWAISAGFFEIPLHNPEWSWVGIQHYVALASDAAFRQSLWLSVVFAVGSVVLQLVAGVGLALVISKDFKFDKVVRAIMFLPYLIPTAILGFAAIWMTNSQWGIINYMLIYAGLIDNTIPWLGSESLAMFSAIVISSWKYTIFVTIMVVARLQGIPHGYYEAANVAGANAWQRFRDITLPNLKGVIFIVVLLRGIWMFLKYDIIWILTRGGPDNATRISALYAYETAFNFNQLGQAAAISTVLFLLLVGVAIAYFVVLEPEQEVRVE